MKNIIILGHGVGVKFVIESLQSSNSEYKVAGLVTHPLIDHKEDLEMIENRKDLYGNYAYNVFDVVEDYNIDLIESANVNENRVIRWIEKFNPKYIISIGCRNIIKSVFLNHFKDKVLNIHTTPLPRYRGAASDSWMILNGEWSNKMYGCIHFIDEGIDTGAIIAKSYYTVPDKGYPIDVFKARLDTFNDILLKGLENLEDDNFIPNKQSINESTTFPRLYTPRDGKIDFNKFCGEEIIRFIHAFGYPFQGASCKMGDKTINILKAEFYTDISFHSFATGLIFGKNKENEYKISVKDGYILIKEIEFEGVAIKQNKVFRLGKTLN